MPSSEKRLPSPHCVLSWLRAFVRWDEWYDSKIPLFFLMFNYLVLVAGPPASYSLVFLWFQTTAHFCLYMAFGYSVNDLCDREADLKAGKMRLVAQLPAWKAWTILAVLVGLGIAVLLPLYGRVGGLWPIVLANYVLALFYSLPPVRFKGRGMLGVMIAAAAQRSLPALILAAIFSYWQVEVILMLIFFFIVGLRWIVVHQLLDWQHDVKGNVHTLATTLGDARLARGLRLVIFPLELLTGLITLLLMTIHLPWVAPVLLVGLLQLRFLNSSALSGFRRAPLAGFYFILWPLYLATLVVLFHLSNSWLPLIQGLWLQKGVRTWWQRLRKSNLP